MFREDEYLLPWATLPRGSDYKKEVPFPVDLLNLLVDVCPSLIPWGEKSRVFTQEPYAVCWHMFVGSSIVWCSLAESIRRGVIVGTLI